MTLFASAESKFGLGGGVTPFRIPKPKLSYYVNFISNYLDQDTLTKLSFFVKRMDRLQMTYDVTEVNQYNKKRLIQGKVNYGNLSFSFYDTVDGIGASMVETYNRIQYGDFSNKNNNSWNYDIIGSSFEPSSGLLGLGTSVLGGSNAEWGLLANQSANAAYFFNRIEVYEIYGGVYSQLNFMNPKFVQVDMAGLAVDDSAGNEINIVTKYEGVGFAAIAEPITPALANMFGLPFHNDLSPTPPDISITTGFDLGSSTNGGVLSTVANFLNGSIGGSNSSILNSVNSILNGQTPAILGANTIFQTVNGLFGSTLSGSLPSALSFSPISSLGTILPNVASNISVGNAVRDISAGAVDLGNSISSAFDF